jgi:hypothetical protein
MTLILGVSVCKIGLRLCSRSACDEVTELVADLNRISAAHLTGDAQHGIRVDSYARIRIHLRDRGRSSSEFEGIENVNIQIGDVGGVACHQRRTMDLRQKAVDNRQRAAGIEPAPLIPQSLATARSTGLPTATSQLSRPWLRSIVARGFHMSRSKSGSVPGTARGGSRRPNADRAGHHAIRICFVWTPGRLEARSRSKSRNATE